MRASLPFIPRTLHSSRHKGYSPWYFSTDGNNAGEKLLQSGVKVETEIWIPDSCCNLLRHCILTFILHPTSTSRAFGMWLPGCCQRVWDHLIFLWIWCDIHEVMPKIFDASSVLIPNRFAWVVFVCLFVSDFEIPGDTWQTAKCLPPDFQLFVFQKFTFCSCNSVSSSLKKE